MSSEGKCPVMHGAKKAASGNLANQKWWPEQLNLKVLNQNSSNVNPMGADFDYPAAFKSLDLSAAVHQQARSVSRRSIAGRITVILIRRAVCFGRLSKNMAKKSLGPI